MNLYQAQINKTADLGTPATRTDVLTKISTFAEEVDPNGVWLIPLNPLMETRLLNDEYLTFEVADLTVEIEMP